MQCQDEPISSADSPYHLLGKGRSVYHVFPHRPTRKVDEFAHHMFPEDALLPREELADACGGVVRHGAMWIAGGIHEAIGGGLEVYPCGEGIGFDFLPFGLEF